MARRRHVSPTLVAVAALVGLSMLGFGDPARAMKPSIPPASRSAAQNPRTDGERPISDLPALDKINPAIASDGSTSLVVWSDYLTGSLPQIRAARLDASGGVLGEIAVSPSPAAQSSPSIAFNGTTFFVVWEESGDLFGTRVTPGGSVLDGYGIPVAISRAEAFSAPAVSSNGADFLVAWIGRSTDTGDAVFAKRVTGAGAVLDGAGFEVGSAGLFGGTTAGGPAVAFNGTVYLVVWSADSCPFCGTLLGSRVTTAGSVVNPGGFPISLDSSDEYFNEFAPAVSATGTQFFVAWTAERCTQPGNCRDFFDSDVLAGRLSASGTVLGTSNIEVAVDDGFAGAVSVASTSTTSLVVWSDGRSGARDVYAARVSAAGAVLETSGVRVSTASVPDNNAAVTRSGTGFALAWESGVDIAGTVVDGAGTVGGAAKVASAGHAPLQTTPDVAWDGSEVVAVWRESRTGLPDTIRVGRALPGGDPTSGEGTVIASGFDLGDPAIASSGQQQLVVWPQDERISGARLAFGSVIGPNPLVVSPARPDFTFPRSPAVAWNGTNYLVTWSEDNSGNLDLFGARVNPSGTVLDPAGITISSASGDQDVPAVASNGTDFLVVWHDARSGSNSDIYGSRVSGTGSVLDAAGRLVSGAVGDQSNPDVGWNGSSYVAAWQDRRSGTSLDIYGTRLSAGGVVTDVSGVPISTVANDQSRPTLSVTGTDILLVWEDRRSGTGIDLYGARLTTAAAIRDPQGLVISNSSTAEVDPATALLSNGRIVVAYQRSAVEGPYRTEHVFFRVNSPK